MVVGTNTRHDIRTQTFVHFRNASLTSTYSRESTNSQFCGPSSASIHKCVLLCVFRCIYVYIYNHIYVYVSTQATYIYMFTQIYPLILFLVAVKKLELELNLYVYLYTYACKYMYTARLADPPVHPQLCAFVSVCICIYIYTYVCDYTHTIYMRMHLNTHVFICIHVCVYTLTTPNTYIDYECIKFIS